MPNAERWGPAKAYIELAKPRIAVLSALTGLLGFAIASIHSHPLSGALWTALGCGLLSGGCGALNQWMEVREDSLMRRTARRPLPSGRIVPQKGLAFGLLLSLLGLIELALKTNETAFLAGLLGLLLYVGAYTPLKKLTPHATWLGCAAGAAPPLIGWAAAQGSLPWPAWVLFAIQYLWQIPHFLAIFWIHRKDYAAAGFKVLPAVDPGGRLTSYQIALNSLTLLPATLIPAFCGMAGLAYGIGALIAGSIFLGLGLKTSFSLSPADSRKFFAASLAYLPFIYGLLWLSA